MLTLFEKIQNRITQFQFLIKLILFAYDYNNCNVINLEKMILLGGYNQII